MHDQAVGAPESHPARIDEGLDIWLRNKIIFFDLLIFNFFSYLLIFQ